MADEKGWKLLSLLAVALAMVVAGSAAAGPSDKQKCSAPNDILYVGDSGDDTVKMFHPETGAFLGTLGGTSGKLAGPRGLIFRNNHKLLVSNQNVDAVGLNGEVLLFDTKKGRLIDAVVPETDPLGPFAPRGIVLDRNTLYVADMGPDSHPGRISAYHVANGRFLGELYPTGFGGDRFNPRGLVFGPDGGLYATSNDNLFDPNLGPLRPLVGYVIRFDLKTGGFRGVAFNNDNGVNEPGEMDELHRPEGIVFGPDGMLYVASFRANPSDTDKILVIDPATGQLSHSIDLYVPNVANPNSVRVFAQALLFGPSGKLYVPISGGVEAGAIRVYDVDYDPATEEATFTTLVSSGGPLLSGWYLTFGRTDPTTLNYIEPCGGQGRQ